MTSNIETIEDIEDEFATYTPEDWSRYYMNLAKKERINKVIPMRYRTGFDGVYPELESMKKFTLNFADTFSKDVKKGFTLSGPQGCGKTHLLYSVTKRLIERGFKVEAYNLATLFANLKRCWDNPETYGPESDLIEEIINADILALDDIGVETSKDFATERLYLIINTFYDNCKPLIITTNCTPDELIKRWGSNGPRLISRIFEIAPEIGGFKHKDFRVSK